MKKALITISEHYPTQGRALEAIWKVVYVLGFEVLKEEENLLTFSKKGFLGMGTRLLTFIIEDKIISLDAEPKDFERIKEKLL